MSENFPMPSFFAQPQIRYLPEEAHHHGQARIAYRLASLYQDKLLYVHGLGWHVWDGTRWKPDTTGAATRAVLDVLRIALGESLGDATGLAADVRKSESSSGIAGVLDIAAALEQFAAAPEEMDADPLVLNTANGTLDLTTMRLRPHYPADRITKVTRAAWDPQATSSAWEQFLEQVLPDEPVRAYFQRFIGLSLLGIVREHIFAIATGTGANGKGTAYNAILNALGDYAHSAESDLFMAAKSNPNGASPAVFALRGKRLVVVSETEKDQRLAVSLMKALTGGDPITARALYSAPITFKPSHTALMVTNYLPKIQGNDPAAWRRIRVIPFNVTVPVGQRDAQLGERLEREADAILTWALDGLADYRAQGMNEPSAVTGATGDYLKASDAVSRFIDEACVVSRAVSARLVQLYEAWERWSANDDTQHLGKFQFRNEMESHGWKPDETRERVYHGIGVLADD